MDWCLKSSLFHITQAPGKAFAFKPNEPGYWSEGGAVQPIGFSAQGTPTGYNHTCRYDNMRLLLSLP